MGWLGAFWRDMQDAFCPLSEVRELRKELKRLRGENVDKHQALLRLRVDHAETLSANDSLNETIDKLRDRLRKLSTGNQKLAFVADGTLKDAGLDSDD